MRDCLNRNKVIIALAHRECGNDEYDIAVNDCIETVKRLPAANMKPQWIPCNKRFPKYEETVLICTDKGKVCCAIYEDGTMRENNSSWNWYEIEYAGWDDKEDCGIIPEGWWEHTMFHPDCEFDCPVDEKVIAWMPLPSPYKKESK